MTIYNVLFGLISAGITLGKGDFLNVSSGGVANGIVVGNRGNLVVSAGGTTTATEVDSRGTETVNSGGTASGSIVEDGGVEQVNPGGTITGTILSGGNAFISNGAADFGVLSAGNEFVSSGGMAHGNVVSAKGKLFVFSAGVASGNVLSGGYEFAFSGGVVTATQVGSGSVVQVQSSGTAMGSIVNSGGQETVLAGGTAENEVISSGAFDIVFGQAGGAVIRGGQNVFLGGMASGTVVDSGGIQLLSAGAVAIDTIVNNGGQEVMLADNVASGTRLNAGGTIDVPNLLFISGGSAVLNPLNDVLTVVEGLESFQMTLSGSYAAGSFEALQDSSLGTMITIAGSDPPAPRTLEWNGAPDVNFADAADWTDITDDLLPATVAPGATDVAEFLTEGGAITGTGIAAALEFGGNTSWNVTSGADLGAETEVTVGQGGDDELMINDGATIDGLGTFDDFSGVLGGHASVIVDGTGSTWRSSGELIVGDAGAGELTVTNAANVSAAAAGSLPAMALGAGGGGTGSLLVTGAGSRAMFTGELDVGQAGGGTLTVSNQATVQIGASLGLPSSGLDIAELPGGSGEATVTGVNSLLSNAGRFIVGDAGLGGLSVAAGASVTTTADAIIANTSDASGSSVNVTGAGSNLTVAGTLIVGDAGSGSLSLSQGASVTAAALDVAASATGDGSVSLVGAGTTLTVTGALTLGDQAAGELSILGGARMTIAGGLVGGLSGAGGNLDIEGTGSQLTINGGTLVVGENGPAEFTLGIGATLKGEVATDLFGITNEFGDVDPATDPNDGTLNVGNSQGGSSQEYDFFVANSGTINIKGTATFYTPLVTFETGAQDLSINGLWVIGAKDTLVMNATSVDASQAFDFASAAGAALVIGRVPGADVTNLDTLDGQTMPTLTGSIAPGAANVLAGWAAPIENYASGDAITLAGLAYGSATASGDVVTMWPGAAGQGTPRGSLTFLDKNGNPSNAQAALAATQINALACFVAGTWIGTADGWRTVETLRVGDLVRTVRGSTVGRIGRGCTVSQDGQCEPAVWVGSRTVDCRAHPKPETVWPVRVSAGAFGENVPVRDLYLSPDHAVFVNEVLVPVRLLVNGTSIVQVERKHVVYYHVELPEHAVIVAEGLAVESYLDTGDRANFTAGGTIRLYPDFAARLAPNAAMTWETKGAARLVMAGEELTVIRHRLDDQGQLLRRRDDERSGEIRDCA